MFAIFIFCNSGIKSVQGYQLWIALPESEENISPSSSYLAAAEVLVCNINSFLKCRGPNLKFV